MTVGEIVPVENCVALKQMHSQVTPALILLLIVDKAIRCGGDFAQALPDSSAFGIVQSFEKFDDFDIQQQSSLHSRLLVLCPKRRAASSSEIHLPGSSSFAASL